MSSSGWDFVKFQKRAIGDPEGFYDLSFLEKPRESPYGRTQFAQKLAMEFSEEDYLEISEACRKRKMPWYASPWDVPSVEFLENLHAPCYKIASFILHKERVLDAIHATGKPVLLSTGLSDMKRIDWAVKKFSDRDMVVMHCVGLYPCPVKHTHLEMIPILKRRYELPVGYSGHEEGIVPSVLAMLIGACLIERHVTLDRDMYGSDQKASLDPAGIEILGRVLRENTETLELSQFGFHNLYNIRNLGLIEGEQEVLDRMLAQASKE